MQLTLDFDNKFVEELKKEFAAPSVKEALYQLLEFYKKSNMHIEENLEVINKDDEEFQEILSARKRRENGEKTYSIDTVLKEFE